MLSKDFNFTEDELIKLNIHDLRELAREVGVISPTTKAKNELVENILTIIYGQDLFEDMKSAAGRPARKKDKPSVLLFDYSKDKKQEEKKINPFYEKYKDDPAEMFGDYVYKNDSEYHELYNPYNESKVASSKKGYDLENDNDDNDDSSYNYEEDYEKHKHLINSIFTQEMYDHVMEIRKVKEEDSQYEKIKEDISKRKENIFISGYVFLGALNRLYVAFPEEECDEQVIYLIPDTIKELYNLNAGDYIESWADTNINVVIIITSVNGKIIF